MIASSTLPGGSRAAVRAAIEKRYTLPGQAVGGAAPAFVHAR
ncbi:MAG TPA: hypothetical protein VK427_06945 [Kofleriaceae bacterium]|nr:hypothetical protein [Kofleriaceae bacterium]